MSARDRECGHGLGKFCREREAAFAERRQILDAAMVPVRQMEDPQLDAAIRIVAWVTPNNGHERGGARRPLCAKPGHKRRFIRSPRRREGVTRWARRGRALLQSSC